MSNSQWSIADSELSREKLFRSVLDSIGDPIFVKDLSGRYVAINLACAESVGLPSEALLGKTDQQIWPDLANSLRENDLYVLRTNERLVINESVLVNGQARTFSTTKTALRDETGKVIGIIGVARDIDDHTRDVLELQQRSEQQQEALAFNQQNQSRRLLMVQEQERRHLARELHDEFGQVLTAINLNLHALQKSVDESGKERLKECVQFVQQAIHRARDLSIALRPSMLDDLGLEPALRWLLNQQANLGAFQFSLVCHVPPRSVSSEIQTACYRIVQEAVTNVCRHAKAQRIKVRAIRQTSKVLLTVSDNGIGFETEAAFKRAHHGSSFGVLGMRERVELLEGEFHIQSSPGKGTSLTATFPVRQTSDVFETSEALAE